MKPKPPTLRCLRCGHHWRQRGPLKPIRCPGCRAQFYDAPSVRVRLARKRTGYRRDKQAHQQARAKVPPERRSEIARLGAKARKRQPPEAE